MVTSAKVEHVVNELINVWQSQTQPNLNGGGGWNLCCGASLRHPNGDRPELCPDGTAAQWTSWGACKDETHREAEYLCRTKVQRAEAHYGPDPQADDVKRRAEYLIGRACVFPKQPPDQIVLVDVPHAGCAKLVPADLDAFHVCPIELKNTTSIRKYFVLQEVSDPAEESEPRHGNALYAYSSKRYNWDSLTQCFKNFQSKAPSSISRARVSIRLGQVFFWGRKLSQTTAQEPGSINQMSYKDCREQFAARLKKVVERKFTEILHKSSFQRFQQLLNITFYIMPEGNGEKRETTFRDPRRTMERRAEIRRLWACTSHAEVLRLGGNKTRASSRVEMASRVLRQSLHPAQNEFKGGKLAVNAIEQAYLNPIDSATWQHFAMQTLTWWPGIL